MANQDKAFVPLRVLANHVVHPVLHSSSTAARRNPAGMGQAFGGVHETKHPTPSLSSETDCEVPNPPTSLTVGQRHQAYAAHQHAQQRQAVSFNIS